MPDETVQADDLGRIVAAEAEYQDISVETLLGWVTERAYCVAPAGVSDVEAHEWGDRWIAPPESHERMSQHRWDELTRMYAERHCAPCPVKDACLALSEREPHNYRGRICGGLLPKDRLLVPAAETVGEAR